MKKSHSSHLIRMPREHGGSEAEALDVMMVCGSNEVAGATGNSSGEVRVAAGKPSRKYPGRCEQGVGLLCSQGLVNEDAEGKSTYSASVLFCPGYLLMFFLPSFPCISCLVN